MASVKFCPQCGNALPEPNPSFCSQCGTKLDVVITATPPIETDRTLSAPKRVSFRRAIELGFRGYVDFRGRSSRAEFWWWTLFFCMGILIMELVNGFISSVPGETGWVIYESEYQYFGILDTLFYISLLPPTFAVTCRRLHDIDASGWWQCLPEVIGLIGGFIIGFMAAASGKPIPELPLLVVGLVPFVIFLIILIRKGTVGPNRYGPDQSHTN